MIGDTPKDMKEQDYSHLSWRPWRPGEFHRINRIQWDHEEIRSIVQKVFMEDWFAQGAVNREFERRFSDYTGIPHVYGTNSGSSAIQNGLQALKQEGYWRKEDLVLHPVTTFATSVSSASFLGMTPVFIDTKPYTYVADPEQVKKAIKKYPNIKGMILPHLIGNIPDMDAIRHHLGDRFLLEDCCDTLGGTFNGQHVGSMGDVAAFSFYASHHITTGGVGGAVGTKHSPLESALRSLIHWGRDFKDGDDEFLKRYNYSSLGTDSQLSAIQAAFGLAQLDKLGDFVDARSRQFKEMNELFEECKYFHLPRVHPSANPSWFAYPLTVEARAPFSRAEFARYLTRNKVEVRPLMCGDVTKQPPFSRAKYISFGSYSVANEIENNSLFVPCWGMADEQKKEYYKIFRDFFSRYSGRSKVVSKQANQAVVS